MKQALRNFFLVGYEFFPGLTSFFAVSLHALPEKPQNVAENHVFSSQLIKRAPKMRQIFLSWLAYLQTEAGAADSKRILRLLFVNIFDIAGELLAPAVDGLFFVALWR